MWIRMRRKVMKRGPRAIVTAGLTALAIVGSTLASTTPASAYWHRYYYWHHGYYGWRHHYWHHHYYAWHRHHYYGPGPILGGLGLLAGTAAALTVGSWPYYYGPYYGPYW
jgi:hypothetical protein